MTHSRNRLMSSHTPHGVFIHTRNVFHTMLSDQFHNLCKAVAEQPVVNIFCVNDVATPDDWNKTERVKGESSPALRMPLVPGRKTLQDKPAWQHGGKQQVVLGVGGVLTNWPQIIWKKQFKISKMICLILHCKEKKDEHRCHVVCLWACHDNSLLGDKLSH